ncbi:hypothetical protein D3C85_1579670 [compost metagenome]
MQLIEQRLELGIGNLIVAGSHHWRWRNGCLGLRLDGVQRVEQLFEFIVGNVARVALRFRLGHRFYQWRDFIGRLRFGQARQCRQQLRGGRRDRRPLTDFAEHAVDGVQRFENHVHQL